MMKEYGRASNTVLEACAILSFSPAVVVSESGLSMLPDDGLMDYCHVPKNGGLQQKETKQG